MIRVYINNFDSDQIWSYDEGEGTEEKHCKDVVFGRVMAQTKSDMSKRGSKTEPCCWIQVKNCKASLIPGEILVIE
jgi:hypothetical protein